MANETALKISRQKHSPARKIVTFEGAFAGRSTMMAEITDNRAYKEGLPDYNEVLRIPYYNDKDPSSGEKSLSALKDHISQNKDNISTFVFEPMQGEGGYRPAPREFFVPLLEECRRSNIAVWADEVQTFCRTGEFFCFETLGIGDLIDICTIGKTLQTAATLYTEEYNPRPGLIAGTFSGSSAALSAGIAILEEMESGNYVGPSGKVRTLHKKFVTMLNELNETTCKGQLRDAGGLGLMIGVTALDGKKETVLPFLKTCFKNGLIAFGCGKDPFRVRFLLPATTDDEVIAGTRAILERSIQEYI
jgi:acetylornithine/N-succinyldiaminopimelate aminotransferase